VTNLILGQCRSFIRCFIKTLLVEHPISDWESRPPPSLVWPRNKSLKDCNFGVKKCDCNAQKKRFGDLQRKGRVAWWKCIPSLHYLEVIISMLKLYIAKTCFDGYNFLGTWPHLFLFPQHPHQHYRIAVSPVL
jgi:hypothetical protein